MPDLDEHDAIKVRSMAHLKRACETAANNRKYNSWHTRITLESASARSGMSPQVIHIFTTTFTIIIILGTKVPKSRDYSCGSEWDTWSPTLQGT